MPNLHAPKPLPTVPARNLTIDGPYCRRTPAIWPVAVVAVVVSALIAVHAFASGWL